MDFQDWSEFWWKNVTGAQMVVSQVVDALFNNATVVIDVPADLPWRQQMRSVIEDGFRQVDSKEVLIEIVDAVDDCFEKDPGLFLLQEFGQNQEIRGGYRERSRKTIQEYLKENYVLKNRVVWVKGLSGRQAVKWLDFCKNYCHESTEYGLFVLEVHGGVPRLDSKQLQYTCFSDCVSSYDVQLFGSHIVNNGVNLNSKWKKYISSVAASLCDTDAEVAASFLEEIDVKNDRPLDVIAKIANDEEYRARGADADSKHIFAYQRKGDTEELEARLWKAQVQTLFPIIEMERISIVRQYEYDLQEALNHHCIKQYNVPVNNPVDIELGTLCYLMDVGYFHIFEKVIRDRVYFLHECRNILAHASYCDPAQVRRLLDESQSL